MPTVLQERPTMRSRAGGGLTSMVTSDLVGQLHRLETQRLDAIVRGDAHLLDQLHAANFVLCTPSGETWSREHYLGGLIDGTIDYQRFEVVTPIEVLVDSNLAVLRYRSEIEIRVSGGDPGRLACWHLDIYQRDDTSWRCRWSQATDTITD